MATWGRAAVSLRRGFGRLWGAPPPVFRRALGCGALGSAALGGCWACHQYGLGPRFRVCTVFAAQEEKSQKDSLFSPRRLRFDQFASVLYEGEPYMTPRDFLYSVMLEHVNQEHSWTNDSERGKLHKKMLTKEEVHGMLNIASKTKPSSGLFRNLGDYGLISYTEYLFLLTILTKPHTGFQIAFKMLDVDGNEHVDRREFLKLKNIISKRKEAKPPKDDAEKSGAEVGDEVYTTLQAYFFGRTGNQKLQYKDFCRFMEDLQAEVQEMEFLQFSKGMDTMRREDFAEWLLHYTNEENNEAYWENMRKRIPPGQSITFEEFKSFCLFTNNIEDFAFTVKMISEANRPIGMAEFKRAVSIATGHKLSENVLDTVFKIFDLDGDNCLSHKEFLGVMKDRILRGLKVQPHQGVQGYWKCVKRETLKAAQEALGQSGRSPF